MRGWIEDLAEITGKGGRAVVVTVVSAEGSTPRDAGTKMIVASDSQRGTIGGGHLEWKALEIARNLLKAPAGTGPILQDFPLGPALGQCCGGRAALLFELVAPPSLDIAIFGAGHVGHALVSVLAAIPCRITWIDSRPGLFPVPLPAYVTPVESPAPEHRMASLAPGSFVLIMTHSHQLDQLLVEAALANPDLAYIGLIGSATKRARFWKRLTQRGFSNADLDRLTCPIGIIAAGQNAVIGAGDKHPGAIAISVAAQILQLQAIRDAASKQSSHPQPRLQNGVGL